MSTVPQELQMEIISWLPAESFLSFKLVSKAWHTLVKNPDFIKLHLDRANAAKKHSLICESNAGFFQLKAPYCNTTATPLFLRNIDISAIGNSSNLVGSCNGLICFQKNSASSVGRIRLVIMNPSTRRYRELPAEEPSNHYDNDWLFPVYEFGYSSVLDDYKVVRISKSEVKVYSMSTNSWRRATGNPYAISWNTSTEGVFLNEAFHWMMLTKEDAYRIISFNISEDKFGEVSTPPDCYLKRNRVMILRGCLCLAFSDFGDSACVYEIWAMKEYGVQESWTRQFVISFSNPECVLSKIFDTSTIYHNNDQLLIQGFNGYLFFYDVKMKRTWRFITEVSEDQCITVGGLSDLKVEDYTYIETLVSLKSKETTTLRMDADS